MSRSSLSSIIASLRNLIYDPAVGQRVFSDDELQAVLDQRRKDIRQMPLRNAKTVLPGGTIAYYEFHSPIGGPWESDIVLQRGDTWEELTPEQADLDIGHWTFTDSITTTVYATGKVFDLYAAAILLLKQWLAKIKTEHDISGPAGSFPRSQIQQFIHELIRDYTQEQHPLFVDVVRRDTR